MSLIWPRVDLNDWTPGDPVSPEIIFTFDDRVGGLNGSCLLGPGMMLIADCAAGFIWRIDLRRAPGVRQPGSGWPTTRWRWTPTAKLHRRRNRVSTASVTAPDRLPLVHVDRPESLHARRCQPEDSRPRRWRRVRRRHRQRRRLLSGRRRRIRLRHPAPRNTIDRVPLEPRHGSEVRHIAGDPFDEVLVGPSSAAWRRGPGDHGRVAYVTTDGGTTAPPDGIVRRATLLHSRSATACRVLDARHHTSDLTHEEVLMNRHSEMVTAGDVSIETYVERRRARRRRPPVLRPGRR